MTILYHPKFAREYKKLPKERTPLLHLYNEDALRKPQVIVAEGEIDTLTLLQNGFNACGVLGANSFKEEWAERLAEAEKVYISFDGDEAGREGNKKIAALIGPQARMVSMPEGEDINDYFKTRNPVFRCLFYQSTNNIIGLVAS